MSVKMRQEVEQKIAKALIKSALKAGYAISVDNGDVEEPTKPSKSAKKVFSLMFQTDEDYLFMFNPTNGKHVGWVRFIYGNDGWDVISDYSVNMETIMTEAGKIAEYYAD
jgi:hypothetical protein